MKTKKPKLNVRLLRRIQKHILEDPRRFLMSRYVAYGKPGGTWRPKSFGTPPFDLSDSVPPCGTAACIAGWANILSGASPKVALLTDASRSLGLSGNQDDLLFNYTLWPQPFSWRYDKAESPKDRAKIACERIDHLIKTGK